MASGGPPGSRISPTTVHGALRAGGLLFYALVVIIKNKSYNIRQTCARTASTSKHSNRSMRTGGSGACVRSFSYFFVGPI